MWRRLRAYLGALAERRSIETEIDEELRFHVEQEVDRLVESGVDPAEARRRALRDLGGVASTAEAVRATRSVGLDALWRDVRHGGRALLTARRFSTIGILTIVLTVGGITTVFTLVNSVLLRPLSFPDAGRLVWVAADNAGYPMTLTDAMFLRDQVTTHVDGWAAFTPGYGDTIDPDSDDPIPVQDMRVTPSVLPMFGIRVVLGRPLSEGDANPASPDVALISHDLWQSRFGGRPDVLGQPVPTRRDAVRTIVGVTAPGADVPTNWGTGPMVWSVAREPYGNRSTQVVARLRQGSTPEAARAELRAAATLLPEDEGRTSSARETSVTVLLDRIVGDTKTVLWLFFAAVSCVLLIGVANLISLQAVRNAAREQELCVRAALGAGRWRLMRQLLVEAVLLSAIGGTLGLLLATTAVDVVVGRLPTGFSRAGAIAVDPTVALFAIGVSLVVGLVFGVLPGWRASRPHLSAVMSEGTRGSVFSARRSRLQRSMLVVETALALVLLVGAGLLVNSLGRLMTEPAGMDEANLWTARVSLPPSYRGEPTKLYWSSLLREARALPQITSATLSVNTGEPLSGGDMRVGGVRPEGAEASGDGSSLSLRRVSGGYFETLRIPMLAGRPILDSDTAESEPVAVLNELAATALSPDGSAVGKRLSGFIGRAPIVVGVIPTFTITDIQQEPSPQMYVPAAEESDYNTSVLLFRTGPGARDVDEVVTTVARALEPEAIVDVQTMTAVRWRQLAMERFRTMVLLLFAGTAVFLAVVGVFGVVSYSLLQRTREAGLRIALGATRTHVTALLVRQTLVPCGIGLLIGAAGALWLSRFLSAFLFGIAPTDPATYAAAFGLLALAALGAALLPARRAAAISPMEALRHQ